MATEKRNPTRMSHLKGNKEKLASSRGSAAKKKGKKKTPSTRTSVQKAAGSKKKSSKSSGSALDRIGVSRMSPAGQRAHSRAAAGEGRRIGQNVDISRVRSEAAQTGRLAGQARQAGATVRSRELDHRSREVAAAHRQTNRRDRNYTSSAYSALDTVDRRMAADRERQRAGNAARKSATRSRSTARKATRRAAPKKRSR
jgi:hypothetical protein